MDVRLADLTDTVLVTMLRSVPTFTYMYNYTCAPLINVTSTNSQTLTYIHRYLLPVGLHCMYVIYMYMHYAYWMGMNSLTPVQQYTTIEKMQHFYTYIHIPRSYALLPLEKYLSSGLTLHNTNATHDLYVL